MDEIRDIVLYDKERDGNLNGVYSNNHAITNGRIFTETARLRAPAKFAGVAEIQNYDSFYFDAIEGRVDCTLIFRITNGIYTAEWTLVGEDRPFFVGEGYLMNDRQIAIAYWTPQSR